MAKNQFSQSGWVNDWGFYIADNDVGDIFAMHLHYYQLDDPANLDNEGWKMIWDGIDPTIPFFLNIAYNKINLNSTT